MKKHYNISRLIFSLLLILILTVIVFSNSINNDFTNWDDNEYVTDNIFIKDFSPSGIYTLLMRSKIHLSGTRLSYLTFALEYKLWGLNPVPYHIVNLILHLLNISLVFYLTFLLFNRIEISVITALFFAIHPMHVESVAWISQLKDVLYTFFFIWSLILYHYYLKSNLKIKYLIFSFLLFSLSYHAKLSAVVLPILLLLFDYYYKRKFSLKILYEKVPFIIFVIYLMFGRMIWRLLLSAEKMVTKIEVSQMVVHYAYYERFFLASYSILFYLVKFFAPFQLYSLHPYPIKTDGLLPIEYYLSPFILISIVLLIVWGIFKIKTIKREIIFSLLFFFISIALFSHIIPIKGVVVVADRYTYVPYLGLFFLLGHFYCLAIDNKIKYASYIKNFLLTLFFISTISFSFASWNRNKVWKNSITLFSDVIEKHPEIDLAYINRGNARKLKKDINGALDDYNKALDIRENSPYSYNNRGTIKAELKDYVGAMADFNKAIELHPNYIEAYSNRARLKRTLNDYEGMLIDYNKTIALDHKNIFTLIDRGSAYNFLNEYENALKDFDSAIAFNPKFWEAYNHRGNVKNSLKDFQGAIMDFTKAIELNPSSAKPYNGRGFSKKNLKDFVGALNDFAMAIKLDPSFSEAFNNYGLILQDKKDNDNAMNYFNKAIELNPKFAEAYSNRAVTYSNLQHFQEAMTDLNKAIELSPLFTEAYNNRGNLRAYYGDFQGSIEDFNKVIELDTENAFAYHNRGNSKYKLNQLIEACEDWKKSYSMGLVQAMDAIQRYCE